MRFWLVPLTPAGPTYDSPFCETQASGQVRDDREGLVWGEGRQSGRLGLTCSAQDYGSVD